MYGAVRNRILLAVAIIWLSMPARWSCGDVGANGQWDTASPESQGMSSVKLESLKHALAKRNSKAFLVIRNDKIVYEWYGKGHSRTAKHHTASMAKALVGGVSLAIAISDGRISVDSRAAEFISQWKSDETKSRITIRQLGSHTSGIQDAWVASESARHVNQQDFSGWEGDFWRWRSQDRAKDAFTISRDDAPVIFPPGTEFHYSNPGIGLMTYAVTASLQESEHTDIRSLLRDRVMRMIEVPDNEWSCGYGKTQDVDGLPVVASWGGGSYSANATARVARLMLHNGNWNGKQLIRAEAVKATVSDAGLPGNCGMGWWTNSAGDFGKAPRDAFSGQGAGHQIVLVIPSLNLIVVRNGGQLDSAVSSHTALRQFLFDPLMDSITDVPALQQQPALPYPQSRVITGIDWAPQDSIVRLAEGSDNWPLTWADDDAMYTAYGDGWGFEPRVEKKLSMGFAKILGGPEKPRGVNVRSSSGETLGQGARGMKGSGLLMVDGVLYLWARNAGNSQIAWSSDHGTSWQWADWKLKTSFGCPTFLNFGKNYAGARDGYVYVYSPDSDSAYESSDTMVLARVAKDRIRERSAYEFFQTSDHGMAIWTRDIRRRGPVFSHSGHCYRTGITYNAGLKRYLWCQVHPQSTHSGGPRFQGGFAIYDAPEPWGPWTTVFFTNTWDVGPGETNGFPTKWMSGDGKTLHLVFSGDDCFSIRRATLAVSSVR